VGYFSFSSFSINVDVMRVYVVGGTDPVPSYFGVLCCLTFCCRLAGRVLICFVSVSFGILEFCLWRCFLVFC
jgi:hypothetical protein